MFSNIEYLQSIIKNSKEKKTADPDYHKKYSRKKRELLTDSFVLDQIKRTALKGVKNVNIIDIPKEIIEAKRQTIIIKRQIKNKKS